jgi:hypothetical protein
MRDDEADSVAAELARRGLTAPARLLLDAHRPLGPALSDLGVALGPFAGLLGVSARRVANLAADERGIDRVIAAIDEVDEDT